MSKEMLLLELHCPHCKALLTTGAKVKLDAEMGDGPREELNLLRMSWSTV